MRGLFAALEERAPVVLATVVATGRSVPRHAGSKMLVHADGRTVGSVGGGELESRVVRAAHDALADGRTRLVQHDLVDPTRGDPGVCGGTVQIYLEPHLPPPTVFVVGCGHVGRAVVDLAAWLGLRVVAYDDRPEQVADPSGLRAELTLTGSIEEALAQVRLGADDFVVVVTRNMALDLALLPHLLRAHDGWIGVMGSRRRWATTRARLHDLGIAEDALERVVSPIGLELQAETPEEIAVSILAQVIEAHRVRRAGHDALR